MIYLAGNLFIFISMTFFHSSCAAAAEWKAAKSAKKRPDGRSFPSHALCLVAPIMFARQPCNLSRRDCFWRDETAAAAWPRLVRVSFRRAPEARNYRVGE